METSTPLIGVTLDCLDLDRCASFWAAALGFKDRGHDDEGPFRALFGPKDQPGLHHLTLQVVPEPKMVKNRSHLDLFFVTLDDEVDRLCALGASVLRRDHEPSAPFRTVVMADPDGNEFCAVELPSR